jgi:flavin reductase (DIM6/NTAB) family NADH-FMN oxidoreductase RutF
VTPAALPIEQADFRTLRSTLGCFATGVTIVTAVSPDGTRAGVTANSFTSVSLDPPLVSVNLGRKLHSLPVFRAARSFAINVLSERQLDLARIFASPRADKWHGIEVVQGLSGCPLIGGAAGVFECEKHAAYDGGDHEIFVGRVYRAHAAAELRPLIFHGGEFTTLAQSLAMKINMLPT